MRGNILNYTLGVEKFDEIDLSVTVKEIKVFFVFSLLWPKFKNSKWSPFLGRTKFVENWAEYIA